MLHFVIPFKSKQVSRNWARDSCFCLRTINGLLKQTSEAYTVTLACHQRPDGFESVASHPKVRLIERPDFWVPSDPSHLPSLLADKDRKLRAAMISLRKYDEGYIMPVDADDAVHVKMTEYIVSDERNADLYYADLGYMYDQATGILLLKRSMHRRMGSSLIFRWNAGELPQDENDKTKPTLFTNDNGNLNHSNVVDNVRKMKDRVTRPIPFPSVCYMVGTGLNVIGAGYGKSGTLIERMKNISKGLIRFWQLRYPSQSWREKFGLN